VKKIPTEEAIEATNTTTPAIPPPAQDPAEKHTIEHWQIVCGTPQWLWAGMKLGKSWPIGKEVTRKEYEAAVEWAGGVTCR
jgi:hypothetical protein